MVRYLAKILNPFQHILNLDPTEEDPEIELPAAGVVMECKIQRAPRGRES